MPAKKRCARCHRLVPKGTTYCTTHLREYEGRRGAPTQRGYGREYRTQRLEWAARIEAGERVTCWRCGHPIQPGTAWDLGHDDLDRAKINGPEHRRCNRSAAGQVGAAITNHW